MRKHFYLSFLLFISFAFQGNAQDTVRVDNVKYSNYQKMLNRKETFILEEAREVWKYWSIRLDAVVQRDQNRQIVASAIRIGYRPAELFSTIPDHSRSSYLDRDEVDSLVKSLELYASMHERKNYSGVDKIMAYNSRGGVHAICYISAEYWRVRLYTEADPANTLIEFNIKRLRKFIDVLKLYQGFQDPEGTN